MKIQQFCDFSSHEEQKFQSLTHDKNVQLINLLSEIFV